jgi:hypothetical protein
MLTLVEAVNAKFGAFTVRLMLAVDVSEPDVPVIVTALVPVAAVLPAAKFRMVSLVAGLGENVAVTPLGKPEIAKVTLPLNPYCGLTYT